MMTKPENLSCLLWPVIIVWRLSHSCLSIVVRLAAVVAGGLLIAAGILVSSTLVGLIVGIPMIILGVLLMVRGVF